MTVVAAFLCIRPDLPIQSAKEHGRGVLFFFCGNMVTWLENNLWKKIIGFVAKCVRSNSAMFVYLSFLRDVGSLSVPCDESSRLIIYPTVFLLSFLAWKDIHLTQTFKQKGSRNEK